MVGSKQNLYRVQSETQGPAAGPHMIRLMLAMEEDEEALAEEKALAVVTDQLLATTVEL